MNASRLSPELSALSTRTIRPGGTLAPATRTASRRQISFGPSPTLRLAQECAREVAAGERAETSSLMFLGACALTVLAGAAVQLERCLANWASFESFVQAMLG